MGFFEYVTDLHVGASSRARHSKRPPPWTWIARQVANLLNTYPTGLTDAIMRQEIQQRVCVCAYVSVFVCVHACPR